MNQNTKVNEINQTPANEEKPKSTFLPSNYYEKEFFNQAPKMINSMPSQYYNFQQQSEISSEIKKNDQKTFIQPSNLPNCQQNPFNITNNISISNYSINDNQKKETNFDPQFNMQMPGMMSYCSEDIKKRNNKKKNMQNYNQFGNFQNFGDRYNTIENNDNSVESGQVSRNSKNIKKFNRNQSIVSQNFGYLNDDENDGDFDPNENAKLHPQNFFKTKLCPHYLQGNCTRGKKCKFSHSEIELRRMPDLRKTKICQLYMMGRCHMGSNCSFAHGEEEIRKNVDFYKTTICKAFKNGFCPKGQHCNYAHGEEDLRAPTFYDNDSLFMMRNSPYQENFLSNNNENENLPQINQNDGKEEEESQENIPNNNNQQIIQPEVKKN